MASWRDVGLGVAALGLPACTLMAGDSVPADRAENARPLLRAGSIQPGLLGVAALVVLEHAVREDALRAWVGLQRAQLRVHSEAVTWSDGSLGCPQLGQAYTQALVPGWRLVVQGPGREAMYHASQRGQWVLCGSGQTAPGRSGEVTR